MDSDTAIQVIDLTKFYYVVGGLVVANIGTLIGIVITGFKTSIKVTRYFAKLEHQVEENTKDIDAAHSSIRELFKSYRKFLEGNAGN